MKRPICLSRVMLPIYCLKPALWQVGDKMII